MKTVEPRSLLTDKIKEVVPSEEMQTAFLHWKKLMNEKSVEISEFDCFFAGWVLSNPTVREQFKQVREKEIKYDGRIQNILWK